MNPMSPEDARVHLTCALIVSGFPPLQAPLAAYAIHKELDEAPSPVRLDRMQQHLLREGKDYQILSLRLDGEFEPRSASVTAGNSARSEPTG